MTFFFRAERGRDRRGRGRPWDDERGDAACGDARTRDRCRRASCVTAAESCGSRCPAGALSLARERWRRERPVSRQRRPVVPVQDERRFRSVGTEPRLGARLGRRDRHRRRRDEPRLRLRREGAHRRRRQGDRQRRRSGHERSWYQYFGTRHGGDEQLLWVRRRRIRDASAGVRHLPARDGCQRLYGRRHRRRGRGDPRCSCERSVGNQPESRLTAEQRLGRRGAGRGRVRARRRRRRRRGGRQRVREIGRRQPAGLSGSISRRDRGRRIRGDESRRKHLRLDHGRDGRVLLEFRPDAGRARGRRDLNQR